MKIIVWSKYHCSRCEETKNWLDMRGIKYEERKIGDGWSKEDLIEILPNAKTVPQIFIDSEHIGGLEQLQERLAA